MKKKLLYVLLFIVSSIIIYLSIPSNTYLRKALYYQKVRLSDYKIFANRTVKTGKYQPWKAAVGQRSKSVPVQYQKEFTNLGTVAYLVIKDSTVVFEEYWDDYTPDTYSNSFSVAKSSESLE